MRILQNVYIWQLHIVFGDGMSGEMLFKEWAGLIGKKEIIFLAKESIGIWTGEDIRG